MLRFFIKFEIFLRMNDFILLSTTNSLNFMPKESEFKFLMTKFCFLSLPLSLFCK